jgi:hypothetical protein
VYLGRCRLPLQGWGFYWAIFPGRCPGLSHFTPSGQMQAYRKDFPVPELAEGALSEPHIYSVAHASGSEKCVCFDSVFFFFSVSSLLSSFREIPCYSVAMLPLSCPTVANASGSECSDFFPCNSVLIRGKSYASAYSSFRG